METKEKALVEFKNYIRLTEIEFDLKIKQQSSNLLVRISFPEEQTPPLYLELLDVYSPVEIEFIDQVNKDSSSIIDFHTANQYEKKIITIYKKTTC